MSPDIVFEESRVDYLLDLFDKVERDGFVYDPEEDERVTYDASDDPVKVEHLGVVGHGSEIYVPDEVDSIIEFVNSQNE